MFLFVGENSWEVYYAFEKKRCVHMRVSISELETLISHIKYITMNSICKQCVEKVTV